ncbi:MAG: glycosyltransferase [Candidatus Korarchaeum sp.]
MLHCGDETMRFDIVSSDMWLDLPHGASLIRMFESFSKIYGARLSIKVFSKEGLSLDKELCEIRGIEVPRGLESGQLFYYLYVIKRAVEIMRCSSRIVIFDYPLIPSFIVAKILRRDLKGVSLVLSRPIVNNPLHPKNLFYRACLILGRFFVDRFTAISPFEAEEIGKYVGARKVAVVPSVLSTEFLNTPEGCEEALKKYLSERSLEFLDSGRRVLIYHGVIDERRGILRVIESFRKLDSDEYGLAFLGEGPAVGLIRSLEDARVVYLGRVPLEVVPCVLRKAFAGIAWLPSEPRWRYQVPTKVLELMALGKPFIASPLPGTLWVVDECPLAIFQEEMTAESLMRSLERIPELRDDGGICREVASRFSLEESARRLMNVLMPIVGK